jgi:hypothetical protein
MRNLLTVVKIHTKSKLDTVIFFFLFLQIKIYFAHFFMFCPQWCMFVEVNRGIFDIIYSLISGTNFRT